MMRRLPILFALSALLAAPIRAEEEGDKSKPLIEIAILLDTSGSMDGLINQARTHLWAIVNSMALARKDGQLPELRVALYEYGKQSQPAENGYIRLIVPLSTDLDKISEELFKLVTDGGDEYCGMVIQKAVEQLEWTEGDHFRAIFIAGNEPFTQGSVSYEDACKKAIEKSIIVNTIHCGPEQEGIDGKWRHGAELADGQAMNIDQNEQTVQIDAPQDARIAELNGALNKTYLAYGGERKEKLARQEEQDSNAAQSGGSANLAQRAASKSLGMYRNEDWDLCDALEQENFKLEDVKEEELPEEMRGKTLEEKKAIIEKKSAERKAIQEEIKKLSSERDGYVAEQRKQMAESGKDTFESAVQDMLEEQLQEKSFEFEKK